MAATIHTPVFPTRVAHASMYLRRRLMVGALLVLVGALLWTTLTWATNSSLGVDNVGADQTGTAQVIHIVQPGDTLWSIAAQLNPRGDVRDSVDRLARLNGGSALRVGQRLVLGG
ncbi:MAG: LysM peptidoglycan-binding domain-containing protein [Acidimicrobiales bacterium]